MGQPADVAACRVSAEAAAGSGQCPRYVEIGGFLGVAAAVPVGDLVQVGRDPAADALWRWFRRLPRQECRRGARRSRGNVRATEKRARRERFDPRALFADGSHDVSISHHRRAAGGTLGWGTAADWCPSAAEWERDVG